MFLQLEQEQIQGEARDESHQDDIEVLAWSSGVRSDASVPTAGGRGSAMADFQAMNLTKGIDSSSMSLLQQLASGQTISEAKLAAQKPAQSRSSTSLSR